MAEGNREALAFLGRVMAGQSHEVTNVLNTINELAGLQEDLAGGEGREASGALPRLRELAGRIRAQVRRGQDLIACMNRFAHDTDVPRRVFDVRSVLVQVLSLAERPARLGRVELKGDPGPEHQVHEGDPFSLQRAVYSLIEIGMKGPDSWRKIRVRCADNDGGTEITVSGERPLPSSPELERVVDSLRSTLRGEGIDIRQTTADSEVEGFVISLPVDSR